MAVTFKKQIEHLRKQGMTDDKIKAMLFPSPVEVGDSVLFHTPVLDGGSQARAATVTQLGDKDGDVVGLCIMHPTELSFQTAVPFSLDGTPGTWSWKG